MKNSFCVLTIIFLLMNCTGPEIATPTHLFVGTYTNGDSEGIYRLKFDINTGMLSEKIVVAKMENPSFLKLSPDNKYLYAVEESDAYDSFGGSISAFAVQDSSLQLLNTQGTGGAHPCHVALSEDGKTLAVSNYTGGNLALFDIESSGRLKEDKQLIDHKMLDTTKTAHVHMAKFMGSALFTADLGLDGIKKYIKKEGTYQPAEQASLDIALGAGPRHFVFDKNENFLYVINELNATISVFEADNSGEYHQIATVSTLADDFKGANSCADIHLSPDGKFLYGSNRGENTIVIFNVNEQTGQLTLVGREEVQGDWPRNFAIDPSGKFLLVANQKSNSISVFKRDIKKGTLKFLHDTKIGAPVCLEFMRY